MPNLYNLIPSSMLNYDEFQVEINVGAEFTLHSEEIWKNFFEKDPILKDATVLKPILDVAIKTTIEDFRFKRAQKEPMHVMQFDVSVIDHVLKSVQSAINENRIDQEKLSEPFTAFMQRSKSVLDKYIGRVKLLEEEAGDMASEFTKRAKDFRDKISKATDIIDTIIDKDSFKSIPNALNSLKNITDNLCDLKILPEEAKGISDKIYKRILSLAENGLDSEIDKAIGKLKRELFFLTNQAIPDTDLIQRKKEELDEKIAAFLPQKITFDEVLKGIDQGISLLGFILDKTGHHDLARKIVTLGTASTTIIKTIASFGVMAASSGPLAPVLAIGGAIFSIAGLFASNEPSADAIIKQQIDELAKHIDKRFDRIEDMLSIVQQQMIAGFKNVEEMLIKIHEEDRKRFDIIQEMLSTFYKETIAQFAKLEGKIDTLINIADQIRIQIRNLAEILELSFREIYKQSYEALKMDALSYHDVFPYNDDNKIPLYVANKRYIRFLNWTTVNSRNALLTGRYKSDTSYKKMCKDVVEQGIEYNINLLAGFASKQFGIKVPTRLVNIIIWADGARNLINYINKTPELVLLPGNQGNIDELIAAGEDFNKFILEIKNNEETYKDIFSNYRQRFNDLLKISYGFILENQSNEMEKSVNDELIYLWNVYFDFMHTSFIQDLLKIANLDEQTLGKAVALINQDHLSLEDLTISFDLLEKFDHAIGDNKPTLFSKHVKHFNDFKENLLSKLEGDSQVIVKYYINSIDINKPLQAMKVLLKIKGSLAEKRVVQNEGRNLDMRIMENFFMRSSDSAPTPPELCELYKKCNQKLICAAENDTNIKNVLEELTVAQQFLSIFIALGFNRDYSNNSELRSLLKWFLWDEEDFKRYTQADNEKFVLFSLNDNTMGLGKIESFINESRKQAASSSQKNKEFPLVETVINELEVFKKNYFIAQSNVQVNSHNLSNGSHLKDTFPSDVFKDNEIESFRSQFFKLSSPKLPRFNSSTKRQLSKSEMHDTPPSKVLKLL